MAGEATSDGPPHRRTSWSLKSIVEDVAGRPIEELQDPGRPVHPYLRAKADGAGAPPPANGGEEPYDPVDNLYPPLVGRTGREYHGPDHEHHAETLERHRVEPAPNGHRAREPGPSHRPERLYLHYLLLHVDRLSDSGLRYLRQAVEEEIAHRERPPNAAAPPPLPAVPPTSTN
ncbi:MAG: hypothetical protein ACLQD8_04825 [Thermoplasmata archaeon]